MLLAMVFQNVLLEEIDFENETFRISEKLDSAPLLYSMREIGQLNPVLLLDGRMQKIIVCGFRRLRAIRQLGKTHALARVLLEKDSNPIRIFGLALWDNLSHRQLDALEKARVLFKLKSTFGVACNALVQIYLPILGLVPRESILRTYISIDGMHPSLRRLLVEGKLTLSSIECLALLAQEEQDHIASQLDKVRLSASLQRKVLDLLGDLAAMAGTRVGDVLSSDSELRAILDDSRLSLFQRGEQLHAALYRRRNPRISGAVDQFLARKKLLDLPASIRITTDPFFETPGLRVEFDALTAERFREMAAALRRASEMPALDDLFKW